MKKASFFFQMLLIVEAIYCPVWKKKVIIVQDIALSAPSSPSDLITIAFLAAKQLSFKEKTGLLSRNPMTWWLRDSWYEGKEGLVPLGLSNSLFLPR